MRYKRVLVSMFLLLLPLAAVAAEAPVYDGHVATEINGVVPSFTYGEIRAVGGIQYAALDERAG